MGNTRHCERSEAIQRAASAAHIDTIKRPWRLAGSPRRYAPRDDGSTYIVQMARDHCRDGFLQCLFVPQDKRDPLLAMLALDAELLHVRAHVKEEMLGHIRYAWWVESLTAIADGKPPREHPVLQAIAEQSLTAMALKRVEQHAAAYPDPLLTSIELAPLVPDEAKETWTKAGATIAAHRIRFGKRWNSWLTIKLLFAAK